MSQPVENGSLRDVGFFCFCFCFFLRGGGNHFSEGRLMVNHKKLNAASGCAMCYLLRWKVSTLTQVLGEDFTCIYTVVRDFYIHMINRLLWMT